MVVVPVGGLDLCQRGRGLCIRLEAMGVLKCCERLMNDARRAILWKNGFCGGNWETGVVELGNGWL